MMDERAALAEWERRYGNGLRDALASAMRRVRVPRWRAAEHAPGTVADLIRSYRETGEIVVWSGASDLTVWLEPAGNWAFRAFHDFAHVSTSYGFTAAEEIELGAVQCTWAGVGDAFASVVLEEISEQARYFARTGRFLNGNQIAFALRTVDALERARRPYAVR